MTPQLIQTVTFLGASFVLGLALGWAIWRFKSPAQVAEDRTESGYWESRLKIARAERDLGLSRINDLEKEVSSLRAKVTAAH